jgi:hypothetical protein
LKVEKFKWTFHIYGKRLKIGLRLKKYRCFPKTLNGDIKVWPAVHTHSHQPSAISHQPSAISHQNTILFWI